VAIKCPKCNADNPDTKQFCGDCGTPLKPSKDASVTKTIQKPAKGFKKDTVIAKKYKIIKKIGEGGMGVVYKVKDTRLDRTVSLKFLPPELTSDEEAKKRFIQEAKAAAALEHPNICTVYEVDEADGQTFIAMSYIEGQSLKDELKDGPLEIDEAKDIAIQIAEGLKEAHEKGIIHRDVKPANIMLTKRGQAKITDFGLAKLSWGVDLTKPSTILGTVAYMSPEQARGEEVDHRTDIWSFGALLYEMLSGVRPFQKAQEQALIYSILNDKPTPISLIRSDIPTHIEQVIEKALAKKAEERYQNIQKLIQDLKHSISFPKAEKSIVVLPFENLSPDPDQEYFSDGLTEEVISDLSQIRDMIVISRSSAMTYKGTNKKIKEIGAELNVQYALEGSVRKAGNNLRITAQLIDATTDAHLWANKYNGTLDDIFKIQEEVSRSIVDALKLKLNPEEDKRIAERPIDNVRAYELYLKARHEQWRLTEESLAQTLKFLEEGLEIIGENELLYASMGWVHLQYVSGGIDVDEAHFTKAKEFARKALVLNPNSSQGYALLGSINEQWGKIQDAVKGLKKAVEIDPNNTEALWMLGFVYSIAGKGYAAKPLIEHVMNIDPFTPVNYFAPQWRYISEGQFDLALKAIQRAYELDPKNPAIRVCLAASYAYSDLFEEFKKIVDLMEKESPQIVLTTMIRSLQYALEGKKQKTLGTITADFVSLAKTDHVGSYVLACCYALIKEKEKALDWLEIAVKNGRIDYPFLNTYDPFLKNIRGEPRFKKLMERVKHEWESFEV
jgi:serine/threonine protein kinase